MSESSGGIGFRWKVVAAMALLALVAIVLLQNSELVRMRVLFWSLSGEAFLVFAALFGAGLLTGLLLAWSWFRRRPAS